MGRVKKRFKMGRRVSVLASQKGATSVEFAIVCLWLILLLFAMVEFGLYLFNRQVITNACREGARAGIVARPERMSNAEIEQIVRDYSEQHLVTFGSNNTLTVSLLTPVATADDIVNPDDPSERCLQFSCDLEVQADFTYEFLFLSTIGIGAKQIQGRAIMRME
jgi:hypothetical protein